MIPAARHAWVWPLAIALWLLLPAAGAGQDPYEATEADAEATGPPLAGDAEEAPCEPGEADAEDAEGGTGEQGGERAEGEAGEPCPPAEPDDRPNISVQIADDRGGGRAEVWAGTFEYQPGEYVIATERVELRYRDLVLSADRARLDIASNLLTAEGHVVIDEGPRRLTGDTLEYHLDDRTGRLSNATAFVEPDYYFSGAELSKVGDSDYTVVDGVFTSCSPEDPSWTIAMSSAAVTIEEYARIKNARMRFGKVPVFYLPYMLWPAKTTRSSGFLIPRPGYNSRRGGHLGLAYYQTLGRSADLTLFAEPYTEAYYGVGAELRYRPSERSRGVLRTFAVAEPDQAFLDDRGLVFDAAGNLVVDDTARRRVVLDPSRGLGDTRWKVSYLHESNNLFKHFKGVISFQDYSDFEYLPDYDRTVLRQTAPFVYSNAYLSGNIGPHSLNFLVDQREFLPTVQNRFGTPDPRDDTFSTNVLRQLPEIEYRLRSTRLGQTPVYVNLLGSLSYFTVDRGFEGPQVDPDLLAQEADFGYGRADLAPNISVGLSTLPWLSAKLDVGGRVSYYTKSAPEPGTPADQLDSDGLADELTRSFGSSVLEVVGPSFSRIFELGGKRFSKLKHVIEPRWTFTYVGDFDDQARVPRFDEVDGLMPRQDVLFAFVNRLIAKPTDEENEGSFEIASFTLARGYSFDDERPGQRSMTTIPDPDKPGELIPEQSSQLGPIAAALRFNPSRRTSIRLDVLYNTLFSQLEQLTFTGTLGIGDYTELGASLFTTWNPEDGETNKDQLQVSAKLELLKERLFFDAGVRYDLDAEAELGQPSTLNQGYGIRWQGGCYTMQLQWAESSFRGIRDTDLRFLLTLKNVGTFIDLNGNTNSF